MKKPASDNRMGKRILVIFITLILLLSVTLFTDRFLLSYYNRQFIAYGSNAAQSYASRLDSEFYTLGRALTSMLLTDSDFRIMRTHSVSPDDYENASARLTALQNIQSSFENLCTIYGWDYYFWCYETESDTLVDYGQKDYNLRMNQRREVLGLAKDGLLDSFPQGKWYLSGDSLMTLRRLGSQYVGICLNVDSLFVRLANLSLSDRYDILLLDAGGSPVALRTCYHGQLTERSADSGFSSRSSIYSGQFSAGFDETDCSLEFLLENRIMRRVSILQSAMLAFMALALVICALIYFYTRKKIVGPLDYFASRIKDYRIGYRFDESTGIAELDHAARLLNQMTDEIESLKIENYEKELTKKQTELQFEQSRIRPHFFINCLNVIHSLTGIGRIEEVQQLCIDTSNYIRYLFSKSTQLYPLREELRCIENYFSVTRKIYGQQFTYEQEVDPDLLDTLLPALVLQTFAGNAIKHAAAGKPLSIRIEAKKKNDHTALYTISDTGGGFPEDVLASLNSGRSISRDNRYQIGIQNVMQRVRLIYADEAQIRFRNEDGGAQIRLTLPITLPDEEDSN